MDADALGYNEIRTRIAQRFGINLTVNARGRDDYHSLQSRLETGDWLWITEYAANITPLARRVMLEAKGINVGWHIAVYPNDASADTASPDPFTWLASVTHETALAHQLPDLVETALRALTRHEQHHVDPEGNHHVSAGITDWAPDTRLPPRRTASHRRPSPSRIAHHAEISQLYLPRARSQCGATWPSRTLTPLTRG